MIDHGRYQLDFRKPGSARACRTGSSNAFVREFGIGYLKMDYNINAGPGTDQGRAIRRVMDCSSTIVPIWIG